MKTWTIALPLALAATSAVAAKPGGAPANLFADDSPIHLTIQGPISSLVGDRSESARPATLIADGQSYPITLSPRGITRRTRDICDFPPLRVEFTQAPPAGSLFDRQRKLKLVTHCKTSAAFQQKVLLEYSAYRLYNMMSPVSFRVRLLNIDYVDGNGRPYVSRVGFFIEDLGDVAKRNGMTVAHMGSRVPLDQIDVAAGGRFAVFEYLISNYDWSMRAATQGEECCHNGRLLAGTAGSPLVPVPYDFDYSGLVNAPYAVPPESVPINNVRQRIYRGYCAHYAGARATAAQLASRRSEFLGLFATVPGLDPREQTRATNYLQGFFTDVDSGKIFKNCVN